MASPADAGRNTTSVSTASSSWTVNLPATIAAGNLLVVFIRMAASATVSTFTGYTALVSNETGDATDDVTYIYYRWADGSEGSTIGVTMSTTVKGAAIAWRVTGAENPATQVPQNSTVANFTTVANTANPASISPTGGSKDYLFLAIAGCDGEGETFSHGTYLNVQNTNSGTAGAVATNCCIGGGSLQKTTATEDPAAFTHAAAATGGNAYTIAIHPHAPVTFTEAGTLLTTTLLSGADAKVSPIPEVVMAPMVAP